MSTAACGILSFKTLTPLRYPIHLIFGGGNGQKTPLDPLFAVDLTNLGGEKPPMSIEAVVHAEDAGCRGYDSVGTLLR